jgi:hypothetical protein
MERATHHRHGGGPRAMLLVALTTAPVPAATQTFGGDCERRKPDVTLVWYDVFGLFGGSHEPAAAELRGVLCRIGVSADSRLAAPGSAYAADGAVEVAVMLLRSFGGDAAEPERVMGVVPAGLPPGVPRPVRVYLAGIETALGRSLWAEPSPDAILGRAVGRVVAHELFHALAPWEPHADSGLMQASLARDALVGPVPEVDATHARALHGVLLRRGAGPSRTLWAGADVDHVLTAGPAPAAAF